MQRGEIWWANLGKPPGRYPVVLISRQRAIEVRNQVCVALVTPQVRNISSEVQLENFEGIPNPCVINCDEVRMVYKEELIKCIALLPSEKIVAMDNALRFALQLDQGG